MQVWGGVISKAREGEQVASNPHLRRYAVKRPAPIFSRYPSRTRARSAFSTVESDPTDAKFQELRL